MTPLRTALALFLLLVPAIASAHSSMDFASYPEFPDFVRAGATQKLAIFSEVLAFDPAFAVVVTVETNAKVVGFKAGSQWQCTQDGNRVQCYAGQLPVGRFVFDVTVTVPSSGTMTVSTLIESLASDDPETSNNRGVKTARVFEPSACSSWSGITSVTPAGTTTEVKWAPMAGALRYEVYARIDLASERLVATTTDTRAVLRLGAGDVNLTVHAISENCPALISTGGFTSPNPPEVLAVTSIASPLFVEPISVAFDGSEVLIADAGARRIFSHFIGTDGVSEENLAGDVVVTPIAADGGITFGPGRYLYIADRDNDLVRYAYPYSPRPVFTVAGMPNAPGSTDAAGTSARVNAPFAVAANFSSWIYIADSGNHTIRRAIFDIDKGEFAVVTFAGAAGQPGTTDGPVAQARFNDPAGIVTDASITYIADRGNHTIREISSNAVVSTVAGVPGQAGHRDGDAAQALFNRPTGVAVDPWGNLLVTEEGNHTIRKITPTGRVTTVAGTPGVAGATDGIGSGALFNRPALIAVDAAGRIWIPDAGNGKLRLAEYVVPGPKRRSSRK